MDPYSSGEELVIKTRKPYTITKQRERWTEEEHNRFLDALKLYGRAWQRIEEHIGTKTAVQIRSHAQKFFTKLEKEALVKGVPIGQALDIEIPPPRPKRKPSNPYPRKISNDRPNSQVGSKEGKSGSPISSVPHAEHALDLEKEPLAERPGDLKYRRAKENQEEDKNSRSFVLLQASPDISPSSANKNCLPASGVPTKSCRFKEFAPDSDKVVNKDETNESYVTVEPRTKQYSDEIDTKQSFQEIGTCDSTNLVNSHPLNEGKNVELGHSENLETQLKNYVQATQGQTKHVPVHIVDGNLGMNIPNASPHMLYQESMLHQMGGVHSNLFINHSSSTTSEHQSSTSRFTVNQSFPACHPILTPIQHHNDYQSFLNASSTFSNLVVSALLQNPAAHAAASFAASVWPCSSMEAPMGTTGGFPSRQINAAPSMAAIAAATVAAATAWWAAHGLLPLCAPFHMGFNYSPASASTNLVGANQAKSENNERGEETNNPAMETHQMEPEFSKPLQEQQSTSKSPPLSLSDTEESNVLKLSDEVTVTETEPGAEATELHDSNKPKGRKQVDRSSCGSNTPSSSEVETDALGKHEKDKEEVREPAVSHPSTGDAMSRRGRSSSSSSDSWKEVSEEGRLAFQALFSRQVLPQSFSPPHDSKNKEKNNAEKDADGKDAEGSQFDLNGKVWLNCSSNQQVEQNAYVRSENNSKEKGLLAMGKLKARHTGFKPYKRCSVEAKESRVLSSISQDEERGPKRMRLEGEAST